MSVVEDGGVDTRAADARVRGVATATIRIDDLTEERLGLVLHHTRTNLVRKQDKKYYLQKIRRMRRRR